MKFMRLFLLILTIGLLLSACSDDEASSENEEVNDENLENLNETGMPIVEESIELDIFAGKSPSTADNWNDVLIWNEYEDMTNMDVQWEQVPREGLEEKRNLRLASGDLPDAFYGSGLTKADLLKYGEQGVFLRLNDLIDKHAPNLKKILEENPAIKNGISFHDGSIYSFPTMTDPEHLTIIVGVRPWLNEEWLKTLGMDMPKTTEEFYEYLKAVKTQDPNGNGEADEIPYSTTDIAYLLDWLKGPFAVGNRGNVHNYVDMDPSGDKLRFFPTSEGYKEMLQYVNKLYSEGLIEQNIFSIETNQFLATGAEERYGSVGYWDATQAFGEVGEDYVGAEALAGSDGEQRYAGITSPLMGIGDFAITNQNENPAATVRWVDHFYSDEGQRLFFMGIEGETYEVNEDGEYVYMDKITNSPDGLTLPQELAKYLTHPGGGYPGVLSIKYSPVAREAEATIEGTKRLEPNFIDEVWSEFSYTPEENTKLNPLSTDIEKYVDEMRDKFISGDVSFDEWDNYVETINGMGLEEYMEIKESAYGRYKENQ